jgi:hypothetical protein
MVNKIEHIFIVLVLPTNQCLNIKKTCCTQHTYISMGPMLVGPPGNCPACPWVKMALIVSRDSNLP